LRGQALLVVLPGAERGGRHCGVDVITPVVQRWRERRDNYRPAGEVIRTSEYDVAEIEDDGTAKAFVAAHHYSGTFPAARWRFGLYRRGALAGVAVFSTPVQDAVLTRVFPVPVEDATELGRLVLLDEVPGNGETWFLARAFEILRREGLAGILSMSDPVPRTALDGTVVTPGHIGTIYQAFNGRYIGRASPGTLHIMPDGRSFSNKAASKVRAAQKLGTASPKARGWNYAVEQLVAAGATRPERCGAVIEDGWLQHWLPRVTRTLRHPGNHRYAWALRRGVTVPPALPYPKFTAAPRAARGDLHAA
jgi:hypothetical protein